MDCAHPGEPHTATDVMYTVPESDLTFNEAQVYDNYGPADWNPGDHPTMPDIVARGRERLPQRRWLWIERVGAVVFSAASGSLFPELH